MPQAFLTDPSVWDGFVGRVWHAALSPLALKRDGVIIEIAPGSSAKIACALAAFNFTGTLHLVEAEAGALDIATAKYRTLLPHATIHPHPATLTDALPQLPVAADALLASHALDDMLLAHAQMDDTFNWAVSYGDTVSAATRAAWAQLSSDPAQLRHTIAATAAALNAAIATLAPQHVVFSQYPSATLRDNDMAALNDSAVATLDAVQAQLSMTHHVNDCTPALSALPHYNNAHIGTHVLNPRYWLSCTRKI